MEDNKCWRGVHVSELQTSFNLSQCPRVASSDEHTVLIKTPVPLGKTPECYPSIFNKRDFWDSNHVKLPCSEKNVTMDQINRWHLIRDALNTRIMSSQQLQDAVLSYNKRYAKQWNFSTLHSFFNEVLEESESELFFDILFPKIAELALSLPELITGGIPLLKRGHRLSITLSQLQIACLLANAFLCTFPRRNSTKKDSEYFDYPDINFNRLFQCEDEDRVKSVHGKLKCILNYFRRVLSSVPTGVVTYSRQFVPNNVYPNWPKSNKKLPRLYVSSTGTIEDDGFGLFQVDFANKFVGGGVIGTGCVQEEIRFVICPELILSRLFTQCLGENEALVVTGCERFNKYRGYGQSFEWDGDYVDGTPSDEEGRKYCTVIALDALYFRQNPHDQYLPKNILRDMNKAYVGFSWGSRRKKEELCAVATGNWGCGIYRGNPQLKSFVQLMAAAEVDRDLAYFTFGDTELRDSMASIHKFLSDNEFTVGKLYNFLIDYNTRQLYNTVDLFEFFKAEAIAEISKKEMACERPQTNVRNSFGIPKLDITKRSFCCRTKINDWFSPLNKSDRYSSKITEKMEGNDSIEKEFKLKETLMLMNLYHPPVDSQPAQSVEQQDEYNGFDFLNKFKRSLRKSLNSHVHNKTVVDDDVELKVEDGSTVLQDDAESIANGDNAEPINSNPESGCVKSSCPNNFVEKGVDFLRTENACFQLVDERNLFNEINKVYDDDQILKHSKQMWPDETCSEANNAEKNSLSRPTSIEYIVSQPNKKFIEGDVFLTSDVIVSPIRENNEPILKESDMENVYDEDNSSHGNFPENNSITRTVPLTKGLPSHARDLPESGERAVKRIANVNSFGINNNFSKKRKISDYFNPKSEKVYHEYRNSL